MSSLIDLYIKDRYSGKVRRVGDNQHDMLTINDKGELWYHNLQNGDGAILPDNPDFGYEFVPNENDYGYNCDPRDDEDKEKK